MTMVWETIGCAQTLDENGRFTKGHQPVVKYAHNLDCCSAQHIWNSLNPRTDEDTGTRALRQNMVFRVCFLVIFQQQVTSADYSNY